MIVYRGGPLPLKATTYVSYICTRHSKIGQSGSAIPRQASFHRHLTTPHVRVRDGQ
jgi:hypothetical protein